MTESLTVELAARSYPIYFTEAAKALSITVAELRKAQRRVCVIADADLQAVQPNYLADAGFAPDEILSLPSGEPTKSIECFDQALRFLAANALNRDSALFAFGGGVTGDLTGYVAASYLRGIDFYQIPSTLLSMVDSSVGGKTGINLPEGKNLVGAFWQPQAVFIDTSLLQTLADREFAAGMAEVIKYGLLADAELFNELETCDRLNAASPQLPSILRRCCAIKADIVAADEKETAVSGGRALLNLGHTFAHAIENVAGYGEYLHGEAVAIGLNLATQLSVHLGQIEADVVERVRAVLTRHQLPLQLNAPLAIPQLMSAMQRDKKNRSGRLRFITLEAVGAAVTTEAVDAATIQMIWSTAGTA